MQVALTIAGSDSGGGAGIQADIKSMQANGVFAASAITAITAQNTTAVTAIYELPPELVVAQIDAVLADLPVAAIKVGMLSSPEIIEAVADRLSRLERPIPVVVDPVMVSKGGHPLLRPEAVQTLKEKLLPRATVLTPNTHEAAVLTGSQVVTAAQAAKAARTIRDMGPLCVVVKGGHLAEDLAIDVFWDGEREHRLASERIDTPHTHGTGCTYASAIAANLAKGADLVTAMWRSKRYVTEAIRHGLAIGAGHGPTHHFWYLEPLRLFPYGD